MDVCVSLQVFVGASVLTIKEHLWVCKTWECTYAAVWFRLWCTNPNPAHCTLHQMSCLSESFYPAVALLKVCVCLSKCVWHPCFFYVHLDCVFAALPIYSRPQPAAWKMNCNIRTNGIFCRQPGDFQPDKGHDQAGQFLSSCSGDTFGPTRFPGGGHSEQSRGQRSFHCISYQGSQRSVEKTKEKCSADNTGLLTIYAHSVEYDHLTQNWTI